MATTYTHKEFDNPAVDLSGALVPMRRVIDADGDATPTGVRTFGAAVNDVIKLGWAPRGSVVHDALVQISDMDTNGSPTLVFDLQITDGTTTKTLISGATAGQAGGIARPTLIQATEDGLSFVVPTGAYWYQLKATTAAATSVADGVIVVHVAHHSYRETGEITE